MYTIDTYQSDRRKGATEDDMIVDMDEELPPMPGHSGLGGLLARMKIHADQSGFQNSNAVMERRRIEESRHLKQGRRTRQPRKSRQKGQKQNTTRHASPRCGSSSHSSCHHELLLADSLDAAPGSDGPW
jgi:hypothetical protein